MNRRKFLFFGACAIGVAPELANDAKSSGGFLIDSSGVRREFYRRALDNGWLTRSSERFPIMNSEANWVDIDGRSCSIYRNKHGLFIYQLPAEGDNDPFATFIRTCRRVGD